MRRALSSQATAVLELLSQQRDDRMSIRQLVDLFREGHGSSNSTRASLSRTLRRLRRDGLVELYLHFTSMAERTLVYDNRLAKYEADPEGDYARLLEKIARGEARPYYDRGSAAANLAHLRRDIARDRSHMRNTHVKLTASGLELQTVEAE